MSINEKKGNIWFKTFVTIVPIIIVSMGGVLWEMNNRIVDTTARMDSVAKMTSWTYEDKFTKQDAYALKELFISKLDTTNQKIDDLNNQFSRHLNREHAR